jgi:hypothetical protein
MKLDILGLLGELSPMSIKSKIIWNTLVVRILGDIRDGSRLN